MLGRDDILKIQDLGAPLKLHVPEWQDDVYLRRPSANDRDAWELYCQEHNKKPKEIWRAKLASMLLCDEAGKRIFSDRDVEALGEKSAAALNRIWLAGIDLMKITEAEVAELEKN